MLKSIYDWLLGLFNRIFKTKLIRRIVTNSGYLFSATGISAALSMVQSIFVFRMLGPTGVGLLGVITNYTSSLNRLASFRIHELVVRYVRLYEESGEREKSAAVFKLAGLLEISGALLAFVLIWLLSPLGAEYIAHDRTTAPWFVLYGVIVLVNLMYESSTGLLQVFDRFRKIAVVSAVQSAFTLALVIVIYFNQGDLFAVLLVYIVGKIIGAIGVTGLALLEASRAWGAGWWRVPVSVLAEQRRSLLTFAFSTNFSGSISLVAKDSESLWVSAFLGTTTAGYYKTALSLIGLLQLPISPLPQTTYPELSRQIAREKWGSVRYVLRRGSTLAATYSLPVTVGLVLLGKWVITLMYGTPFLPAYPALVLLLIGYTFVNIFYWNRVALLALNRPVFPTIVNFIGMLLKVAGIMLLVPRFDYLAFAGLLSGYYIFTVGFAALRVNLDVRRKQAAEVPA